MDFSLWPPSVDLVDVSRNNFTCLSVLPVPRIRGLFCVHHSDLNRIIKLSNIFPQLVTSCICATREGRGENSSVLILSSASHDLYNFENSFVSVVTGSIVYHML